jgi:putative acetyltransferase
VSDAANAAGYLIRPGTPEDAEAIWRVRLASIRDLCSADYTPEQIKAWAGRKRPEDYERAIAAGERFWVAVDGEEIVGFSRVSADTLYGLYVAPSRLRRGIGTALLRAAEASARQAGVAELRLGSTLNAEAFYRRQGYAGAGRTSRAMNGVDVPCVRMSKRLDAG